MKNCLTKKSAFWIVLIILWLSGISLYLFLKNEISYSSSVLQLQNIVRKHELNWIEYKKEQKEGKLVVMPPEFTEYWYTGKRFNMNVKNINSKIEKIKNKNKLDWDELFQTQMTLVNKNIELQNRLNRLELIIKHMPPPLIINPPKCYKGKCK